MTACNSDKCHCPQCNEARRERDQDARIGKLEDRVDIAEFKIDEDRHGKREALRRFSRKITDAEAHERIALTMERRQRDFEREEALRYLPTNGTRKVIRNGPRGKIYLGYCDDPCREWRWDQIKPGCWQRFNVATREHFGRPTYRRYFTPDGHVIRPRPHWASGGYVHGIPGGEGTIGTRIPLDGTRVDLNVNISDICRKAEADLEVNTAAWWQREKTLDEAAERQTEINVTIDAKDGFKVVRGRPVRNWHLTPPIKISFPHLHPKKESAMSPEALAVLLYINAHNPRFNDPDVSGRQAHDGYIELLQSEMVVAGASGCDRPMLTDRAKVYIAAIKALPLPVREPAPWVMPS